MARDSQRCRCRPSHPLLNEAALGFCFRSKNKLLFSETLATSRCFERLELSWKRLGLIEAQTGQRVIDDFDGEEYIRYQTATRYRATAELLALAGEFGIRADNIHDHYEKSKPKLYPILLKRRKKKGGNGSGQRMGFKRSPKVEALAAEVREINGFLEGFDFSFGEPPVMRRIFSNGDDKQYKWDQGGRVYSVGDDSYQQMKKELRPLIAIDDERTAELDLRSSHLTILHAKAKRSLPEGDPYALEGIPRMVVKFLVTAIIGKEGLPTRWNPDLKTEYETTYGSPLNKAFVLKEVAQRVEKHFCLLEMMEASGLDTFRLQYVEAQVLITTVLRLLRECEIPSLPVHDSLIVKEKDKETAEAMLKQEFKEQIGVEPVVSLKAVGSANFKAA